MTKTATAATTLRSLTRQAHTFRYGRPCDVTPLMHLIEDEDESFPCDDNAIAYHTGKLAWVISTLDGGDHRIRVHDLRKQLTYEVDAAARSSVEVLAVSETILGYVTTRGYCYAIAHSTRNSRRFRLPSSRVLHLSIRKSKILLLFKIGSASDVLLCKYDYDTGKAVDIKLECRNHPTPGKPVKAFFRSSQETIFIFFERQGLDSIHKILSVGEFSLDGLLLSPRFTDIAGFQDQWRACCNPASYDDLFTITLEPSEETHWPYDTFEETIFQYNGSVDQVLVRKAVRPATNGKAEWGWSSMFPTIHPRFIWKDTMYAWSVNRDSRMLYASSLDGGTSSQGVNQCVALTYPAFASGQMVGQGGHREPHNFGDKFETLWLGGDSKFVFQIGQRESYLWCFDKDF
ncbi:MAG: hypothetical protein M1833_005584 [Piccolia ochrophora]|nr:MAG: hypothetical protein M1833_005584 [Piccolia ochrophora]